MKKKILFIIDSKFPPAIRVLKQSKSLSNNGYDCAVLSPPNQDQTEYEVLDKIKIFRPKLLERGIFDKFYQMVTLFSPRWFFSIRKIVKKYKPDVIHIYDIWLGKSTFAAIKSKPVILDLKENMPAAVQQYSKGFKKIQFALTKIFLNYNRLLSYERNLINKANLVIVVAKEAYNRVLNQHGKLLKKKLFLVENLESKEFLKKSFLKKNVYNKKYFNVSYIGGFAPHRGLETLIKSFIFIKKTDQKIKLNLVGATNSNYLDYLLNIIKFNNLEKYVKIHKWINTKDVKSYISQSNICVVPHESNYHTNTTQPWKLTQYMLAKKPILVSSSPPLARIVSSASAGMIFKASDPEDCFKKIIEMKKNYKNLIKFGENGLKFVLKKKNNWEDKSEKDLLNAYYNLSKKKI